MQEEAETGSSQALSPEELTALLRSFVAASPIPQMVHAAAGRIVALSDAFTTASGYGLDDIPSAVEFLMLARGNDRATAEAMVGHYAERFLGPPPYPHEEVEIVTKDGVRRSWLFHVAAVAEDSEGERYVMSSVVELTEQREAERALASNQEFVDRIFGTHPNALYVYDLEKQEPVFLESPHW